MGNWGSPADSQQNGGSYAFVVSRMSDLTLNGRVLALAMVLSAFLKRVAFLMATNRGVAVLCQHT